jgi:hypothetical protein
LNLVISVKPFAIYDLTDQGLLEDAALLAPASSADPEFTTDV